MALHKTFISYHHANEQDLKNEIIETLGGEYFIDKSVGDGDIDPNNTDETIMNTIRRDFLKDSTVTLVLVGSETSQRPFINSELQASLWGSNPNGLLCVVRDDLYSSLYTSSTCSFGTSIRTRSPEWTTLIPELVRVNHIADNSNCHFNDSEVYCSISSYSSFMKNPTHYIEQAFNKRSNADTLIKQKKLSPDTPKIERVKKSL